MFGKILLLYLSPPMELFLFLAFSAALLVPSALVQSMEVVDMFAERSEEVDNTSWVRRALALGFRGEQLKVEIDANDDFEETEIELFEISAVPTSDELAADVFGMIKRGC